MLDNNKLMIKFFSYILLLLPISLAAKTLPGELDKARKARAILDAWHADEPEVGERKLHVISWRPSDKPFPKDHRGRLQRILEHIQQFYAEELKRNGLGHRSFNLDYDAKGKLVIHEVVGNGKYADYGRPDGDRIRKECVPVLKEAGIEANQETILIFTNLGQWNPVLKTFVHKSPYYAGGDHQSGRAWQLDSPELDIPNLKLKEPMIQDGEYGRISLGKHVSIFIGGIAHEMGHAFGLPHCRESREEKEALGTALMGSGNRTYYDQERGEGKGSFIPLAHALRLASHPQFSGSVKGMYKQTKADFKELEVENSGRQFTVIGKVQANLQVYAVIGYLDPEGGGNYNSRTEVAIPDEEGRFTLDCDEIVAGKTAELRLVACLVNGATHTWRNSYIVGKDGNVDVSAMEVSLKLNEFANHLREGKRAQALEEMKKLPKESLTRKVAESILKGQKNDRETKLASQISKETQSYPLSGVTPESATVGWLKPAYDHLPRPESPFLLSGARIFEHGIYAHVAARHVYDITDAGWTKLKGHCGLPPQRGGSVRFRIRTDGKEVFRSGVIEPGKTASFEISLQKVKKLELLTDDGGDGKAADWGLWLEPTLLR